MSKERPAIQTGAISSSGPWCRGGVSPPEPSRARRPRLYTCGPRRARRPCPYTTATQSVAARRHTARYYPPVTARTLEKITIVVTVAVLGVALAASVRSVAAVPLLVALVVTVCAGLDLVLRGEARYHPTPDLFILPAALVVGATLFLPLLASGAAIVAGLAVFGALLF